MKTSYKIACLFLTLISLYGESNYILCIDGGGSKTILQVVDQQGQVVPLIKNETRSDKIETDGSNINTVGQEGIREVFRSLFENVIVVGEKNIDLVDLIPDSRIVAGMAGVALPQNKQTIISLLEEWGVSHNHILVMFDAEMALQLIEGKGIILISGTGSICLGKKEQTIFRVGGLGKVLGDEGSGYQIGRQALQAAIAEEYGWGISTSLTPILKELFNVTDIKSLIPKINLGEIPPSKIASSAPVVFNKAWEKDAAAEEIINRAAKDLSDLLSTMLRISHLSNCEVHLWGGVFKSVYAETFIQKIMEQMPDTQRNLRVINKSRDNAAVLFARQMVNGD